MPKSMPWSEPPAVLRYGAAIAAVAAAVAVGSLLQPALAPVVSLLLCGVLFAAWFGGLGPGLLATTSGLLAFDYFFLPPLYSLAVQSHNDVLRLIAFAIAALFAVVLSASQRSTAQSLQRAHADLQAVVRELERTNALLRDENTERQRAEAALRQSEKNLQTIIETIPAYVVRYQADGTPDFLNQTLRDFVGPSVGLDGMRSAVHPDDLPQNLRDWRARVAVGEPYENEMRLRRADGAYRWHRLRRVPLRDTNGAIVNWYGAGYDIDDQKRAETALRQSEENLQTIIDTIPALVTRYRSDGTADFMNHTMREFIGPGVVLDGKNSTVHPEDYPQRSRDWRAHVAAGEPYENEMRLRRADGVYRWHRVTRVPLRDANGAIVNWYGVGFDIDDQKRAEDRLRRSEAHLAEAQRLSHTGASAYNATTILYWSEETYRIFGFDPRDGHPSREAVWQRIHPDDRNRVRAEVEHTLNGKGGFSSEFRIVLPDGTVKYVESIREPVFSPSGELVEIVATQVDVTKRKRAEQALRRSEFYLAEAQRLSHSGSAVYNETTVLYWSEETYRIWGLDPLQGIPSLEAVRQRIDPDDRDRAYEEAEQALREKRGHSIGYRIILPDGTAKHLESTSKPVFSATGELVEVLATQVDVTERKRAEDALRRSRAYLAEAQRLSATGSFGWRTSSNTTFWSKETYRIFDVDPAVEPSVELVLERTHPDDREFVNRLIERMSKEDRDFDYEHRLLLPGGIITHLHVRTHRVRFDRGEMEIVGALMDVTAARKGEDDLRHAQAELAHASRVATLGELSASIAHEVHQPLTAIVASGNAAVRWLDREVPECARAIRSVTRMISEAHRASQVILRIRELAKKAEPEMAQVDINGLVEDVVTLVHREATGQRVVVRTQLASELPPVLGDRVQLQQVLINLVMNGIQAMAPVTDWTRVLVIRTGRHDADQILVAVEDTGIGIESDNLNRLFGAFYTTKPDGMGMGLSISRSIVEAHGGSISATRNSGPGMTFQFTLSPYREQAAAPGRFS
jgi:PAS domain S-box-containing protein